MSEHMRTTNPHNGQVWQWVERELCMVIDRVTGEPERIGPWRTIAPLEEALAYVGKRHGWEDRFAVVRLPAVVAYRVAAAEVTT